MWLQLFLWYTWWLLQKQVYKKDIDENVNSFLLFSTLFDVFAVIW